MIEKLLAIGMALSAPVSSPAGHYDLEVGTHGFTGHTVEIIEVVEPEEVSPSPVEVILEDREDVAASRSEAREIAPPAPTPVDIPEAPTAAPSGILGIAASYVGAPYVLYGTPPAAFDCSGYTWWVFQQAGISIPRSVDGQKAAATPVSDPQPGDLVFYNDWHHVGIYAGDGMTYEALNPGTGVRYGPILSSNVWYGRP